MKRAWILVGLLAIVGCGSGGNLPPSVPGRWVGTFAQSNAPATAQDQVDAMTRAVEVPDDLAEDVVYLMRFAMEHPTLEVDCTPRELEERAAATIAAIHEEEAFPGRGRYRVAELLFAPVFDESGEFLT